MKLLSLSALVGMISVLTIRSANALTFVPRLPRACYFTFDKHFVCGSDGKTYDNPSVLNCAKEFDPSITLVHEGKCDTFCLTTKELDYMCGSDGKTYDNWSVLNCAKKSDPSITLVHEGKCDKDAAPRLPIACYFTFDKHFVCGSDGKTYDNPSVLNCAKEFDPSITLVHEGKCDEDAVPRLPRLCPTTGDIHFVCGSDGKTYDNPSVFNCAKELDPSITLVHEGKCDKDAVPRLPIACYFTFDKHFVCGSDGKTYDNPSVLNCAKEFDPSITLVHEGMCDEDADYH